MSARGGPDLPFTPDEICAKIYYIVDDPYPRMGVVMDALLGLDANALAQPWNDAVREMTAL